MTRRITILGAVLMILFFLLFLQLNNVQGKQASALANNPANPAQSGKKFANCEGDIDAADGTVLAESLPTNAGPGSYQCYRTYPQGSLYEQAVGYNSIVFDSAHGIEAAYKSDLESHKKPIKTLGDLLSTHQVQDTVTLTIQPKIQQAAQKALDFQLLTDFPSGYTPYGAVVALDPSTGAILAMYAVPSFDPNQLSSSDAQSVNSAWTTINGPYGPIKGISENLDLATADSFAPGSTFKIITTSAAYQDAPQLINKVYPSVPCIPPSSGYVAPPWNALPAIPGLTEPFCNFGNYWQQGTPAPQTVTGGCGGTIATMLPPSCDTGYAYLGVDIGASNLSSEADSYGFGQSPNIGTGPHAVAPSAFTSANLNDNGILAHSAVGQQDVQATPLQMAMVAATIANGGQEMSPHLVDHIYDSMGNLVYKYQPSVWKTPVSPQTAQSISALMQQVTQASAGGTAAGIFNPADDVGAKTGTAQSASIPIPGQASLTSTTNDWMIAFAPASHPTIAVAVCVPYVPTHAGSAGDTVQGAFFAGPVASAVIQAALGH